MILSKTELIELTGKKRPKTQKVELVALGIPFKERTDGTLVVYHVHAYPTVPQPTEPRLYL